MKALPKRKGNDLHHRVMSVKACASMKAPPKRKGNAVCSAWHSGKPKASMKALPKRKGNAVQEDGRVILSEPQ